MLAFECPISKWRQEKPQSTPDFIQLVPCDTSRLFDSGAEGEHEAVVAMMTHIKSTHKDELVEFIMDNAPWLYSVRLVKESKPVTPGDLRPQSI